MNNMHKTIQAATSSNTKKNNKFTENNTMSNKRSVHAVTIAGFASTAMFLEGCFCPDGKSGWFCPDDGGSMITCENDPSICTLGQVCYNVSDSWQCGRCTVLGTGDPGYILQEECVSECPDGFWENDDTTTAERPQWTCQPCHASCASCSGPEKNQCDSCKTDTYLITKELDPEHGSCVSEKACVDIHYGYTAEALCLPCHSTDDPYANFNSCGTCDGPAADNCLTCPTTVTTILRTTGQDNNYLIDRRCVTEDQCHAEPGFAGEAPVCVACNIPTERYCLTCTQDATTCDSCQTDENGLLWSIYPPTGHCIETCPPNWYKDESSDVHVCEPCGYETPSPNICETCLPTSPEDCQTCPDGKLLEYGKCVNKCQDNHYPNGDVCQECSPPGDNDCVQCNVDPPLVCSECPPEAPHLTQDGGCIDCSTQRNHFVDPSTTPHTCTPCENTDTVCLTCDVSDPTACLTCPGNQFLDTDGNCVTECDPNYWGDTGPDQDVCAPCTPANDVACGTCDSSPSQCDSCQNGFYLHPENYTCVTNCPSGFFADSADNTCRRCAAGKFLDPIDTNPSGECKSTCPENHYENNDDRTCEECKVPDSICDRCNPALDTCLSCQSNWFLHPTDGTCNESCPEGYFADGALKKCRSCDSPTFLHPVNGTCGICPANTYESTSPTRTCKDCQLTNDVACGTCDSSPSQCDSCQDGTYLHDHACVRDCPPGYFADSSDGPNKNTCRRCDASDCPSGSSADTCENTFLHPIDASPSGTCEPTCPVNHYENTDDRTCEECKDGLTCFRCNSDLDTCLSCQSHWFLQPADSDDKVQCKESCPNGYYQDESDWTCKPCDPDSNCQTYDDACGCVDCPRYYPFVVTGPPRRCVCITDPTTSSDCVAACPAERPYVDQLGQCHDNPDCPDSANPDCKIPITGVNNIFYLDKSNSMSMTKWCESWSSGSKEICLKDAVTLLERLDPFMDNQPTRVVRFWGNHEVIDERNTEGLDFQKARDGWENTDGYTKVWELVATDIESNFYPLPALEGKLRIYIITDGEDTKSTQSASWDENKNYRGNGGIPNMINYLTTKSLSMCEFHVMIVGDNEDLRSDYRDLAESTGGSFVYYEADDRQDQIDVMIDSTCRAIPDRDDDEECLRVKGFAPPLPTPDQENVTATNSNGVVAGDLL